MNCITLLSPGMCLPKRHCHGVGLGWFSNFQMPAGLQEEFVALYHMENKLILLGEERGALLDILAEKELENTWHRK